MKKQIKLLAALIITPLISAAYEAEWGNISADERLDMLKNALVDYTLDQGVSVNATAWIDQTGAMEESVYLVSSMQLESLRFSEYLNEFGFPEMAIVKVPEGASEHVRACGSGSKLKRRILVHPITVESSYNSSSRLGEEVGTSILQTIQRSAKLKDSALIELQRKISESPFVQYMTEARSEIPDINVRIKIIVRQRDGFRFGNQIFAEFRPTKYDFYIELVAEESQEVFFSDGTYLSVDTVSSHYQMPTLASDDKANVELFHATNALVDRFSRILKCRTVANLRLVDGFGERRLNGGRDVGVAKGQQFLLLPGSHQFSGMGLKRATESIALVEIENVSDVYSTVEALSGRLPMYGSTGFIAIPLDAVDFFKNRS